MSTFVHIYAIFPSTLPPLITVVGGVFMVEHLNIYKIIIEKVAKYLLLPGIELDINLNIRVSVCSVC